MKLSRIERWFLVNQYRILEKLYPEDAESLAEDREALQRGYEAHYSGMIDFIYKDEHTLSAERSREVLDILSMHRALHYGYDALSDKSGIEPAFVQFAGFDGNDEEEGLLLGYARWFCDSDGGRFKELHRGDDFNSHMPMLGFYRAMLKEWQKSRDKNKLTKDDILRITSIYDRKDR